jgi:hypothetical protein
VKLIERERSNYTALLPHGLSIGLDPFLKGFDIDTKIGRWSLRILGLPHDRRWLYANRADNAVVVFDYLFHEIDRSKELAISTCHAISFAFAFLPPQRWRSTTMTLSGTALYCRHHKEVQAAPPECEASRFN